MNAVPCNPAESSYCGVCPDCIKQFGGLRGKSRLLISYSGGRTSAYMTKRILDQYADVFEIAVVFANTGEEHEETLRFIKNCDDVFNFNTVWIEAITHLNEHRSSTAKIVTFETASRHGEPFEAMIQKYGIPNKTHPHCTRSLKRYPIEDYMRSIGWGGPRDYLIALGIRADEQRRVKQSADRHVVYPLVHWFPTTKPEIIDWWEDQSFDLQLKEHQGNCKWCWKKSLKKHARLVAEAPEIYDFPARMEEQYGYVAPCTEYAESLPRVFFRDRLSTAMLKQRVITVTPWRGGPTDRAEEDSGCSESCELFPTDESDGADHEPR